MPTPTKGPRLGGSPAHQRLMLANLATSLFKHGRITTTETKARRLRPLAERMITFAKRDDLTSRRRVRRVIQEKDTFVTLFEEIAPRYANRPGGYTRIVKTGPRRGDNAPMAVIELVEELVEAPAQPARKKAAKQAAQQDKVAALAGDTAEPVADEVEATDAKAAELESATDGTASDESKADEAKTDESKA